MHVYTLFLLGVHGEGSKFDLRYVEKLCSGLVNQQTLRQLDLSENNLGPQVIKVGKYVCSCVCTCARMLPSAVLNLVLICVLKGGCIVCTILLLHPLVTGESK